jgi:predicted metal-dependent hydrolase
VKRVGYCSVLMKVIVISSVLDSQEIPKFVVDYVLYHELTHLNKGFDPFGQKHGIDFLALEHIFPMHSEANEWLKRLKLFI